MDEPSHTYRNKIILIVLAVVIAIGFALFKTLVSVRYESSEAASPTIPYDVVVIGAGTGGVAAAIQAARMGSSVALLEETDIIGGQAVAAGVSTMDGGFSYPTGIWKEFLDQVRSYYSAKGLSIGTCYWWSIHNCFEPKVGQSILLSMLNATGRVTIKTQTYVTKVLMNGNKVTGVVTNKGTTINAKQLIEATEYGDILPLVPGLSYRAGNQVSPLSGDQSKVCVQDITYTMVVKKYPGGIPANLKITSIPDPATYAAHRAKFVAVVTNTGGEYGQQAPFKWSAFIAYRGVPCENCGINYTANLPDQGKIMKTVLNWPNDFPYSVADLDRTNRQTTNCKAKMETIQLLYYIQQELKQPWSVADDEPYNTAYNQTTNSCKSIPAEFKEIENRMPQMPYVRESLRGIGIKTITAKDLHRDPATKISRIPSKSAIALGDYSFDLHACNTDANLESSLGETMADNKDNEGIFQVPLEALIPQTIDGIIFAEKNISVSRLAGGAIRLQPITLLTGQAAGALAALAAQSNLQPRNIRAIDVQSVLLDAKSATTLTQFTDVPMTHPLWKSVQISNTYGIMNSTGVNRFGISDTLSRDQAIVIVMRLLNIPLYSPDTPTFTDVPKTNSTYPFIEGAAKAGLTAGCSASPRNFCPRNIVTRGDLAVFLARASGYQQILPITPRYTDVPNNHPLHGFIEYVSARKFMTACDSTGTKFCPGAKLSRGDMAVISAEVLKATLK